MDTLKSTVNEISEITVTLLEDGRIALCKKLGDKPNSMALGQNFKPKNDAEVGEAVMEMLKAD